MRLKDLFTVPKGQKITEKVLYRVLASSICSILLCMTCLAGTTWAWFAVSIENTDNTIAIAEIDTVISVSDGEYDIRPDEEGGIYKLDDGEYQIWISLVDPKGKTTAGSGLLDGQQRPVYVVMTVRYGEQTEYRLFTFENREDIRPHELTVAGDSQAYVSFFVTWVKPAHEIPDCSESLVMGESPEEPETDPTEETTEPGTEPSEEPTVPGTEPSEEPTVPPTTEGPTEPPVTEPETEETTAPPAEETEPPSVTEPPAESPEETTAPTDDPTEPTKAPTEPQETTAPMEAE